MRLLKIPPLSQKDPGWATKQLGSVKGTTLGQFGCLMTCLAMQARYYGFDVTPQDINAWCSAKTDNYGTLRGFIQGDLYLYDSFPKEFPGTLLNGIDVYPLGTLAKTDKIDRSLEALNPVIIKLDYNHNPADGVQEHFVLVVGKDDQGRFIINDPWSGDQIVFNDRYDKPEGSIYKIVYYSGPVPKVIDNNVASVKVLPLLGARARTNPVINSQNIFKVFKQGTVLPVLSQITGDPVDGNPNWYEISDSGRSLYVSAAVVEKTGENVVANLNKLSPEDIKELQEVYKVVKDMLVAEKALPDVNSHSSNSAGIWLKLKQSLHIA